MDSIVLPITPDDLFTFPAFFVVELLSSPQVVSDVSGAACIGKMGYRLFTYDERAKVVPMCKIVICWCQCVAPCL